MQRNANTEVKVAWKACLVVVKVLGREPDSAFLLQVRELECLGFGESIRAFGGGLEVALGRILRIHPIDPGTRVCFMIELLYFVLALV